jgi:hypothetical protein
MAVAAGKAFENKENLWQQVPIPLKRIARFDECDAPMGLADALGDRYLCAHNSVFAGLRAAVRQRGYSFSCSDTDLCRDYQTFPLMSLDRLLSGKVIPYRDSANTLRRLAARYPDMALSAGFIAGNLAPNRAFHESAHCVAHTILNPLRGGSSMPESLHLTVEALFAEAFANTVETLGTLAAGNPIADQIFYNLNSYINRTEKQTVALTRARSLVGEDVRFRILFLSYFEANISDQPADPVVIERVRGAVGVSAEIAEAVRELVEVGFGLNRGFRENTTPAFFAYMGYQKEYAELSSSAWLFLEANRELAARAVELLYAEVSPWLPRLSRVANGMPGASQ